MGFARESHVMCGRIEGMVCSADSSSPKSEPLEYERRKPGAKGTPVILGDGQPWLLANPTYRPRADGLTRPLVDRPFDRVFESSVFNEGLSLCDLWEVARELLRANYDLTDAELARLLSVSPGAESRALATEVLDALFGFDSAERSYTAWVRSSLIANGLDRTDIAARDLLSVLAILVATNRTIPLSRFADACRLQDERARLETLI
jgi:hypothetical protein